MKAFHLLWDLYIIIVTGCCTNALNGRDKWAISINIFFLFLHDNMFWELIIILAQQRQFYNVPTTYSIKQKLENARFYLFIFLFLFIFFFFL